MENIFSYECCKKYTLDYMKGVSLILRICQFFAKWRKSSKILFFLKLFMLSTLSWLLWKLDRLQFINMRNFWRLFNLLRVIASWYKSWKIVTVYSCKSDGQIRYFLYIRIIFTIITRIVPLWRPFPRICSSCSTGQLLFCKILNTSHAKHHIPQGHIPNMIPTWNHWTTHYWKKHPPLLFPSWPTDTRTQCTNPPQHQNLR